MNNFEEWILIDDSFGDRFVGVEPGRYFIFWDKVWDAKRSRFVHELIHHYKRVSLMVKGKPKSFQLHIVICTAYNGQKRLRHEVAHWNDIAFDNDPLNLRWATRQENQDDRVRNNRQARGEAAGLVHLSEVTVKAMVVDIENGMSQKSISDKYNVPANTISYIMSGKSWKHITGFARRDGHLCGGMKSKKLKESDVVEIIQLVKSGYSNKIIAEKFNVKPSTIWAINNLLTWRHVARNAS